MSDSSQFSDRLNGSGPPLATAADFAALRARAHRLRRKPGEQNTLDFEGLRAESQETSGMRDLRGGIGQILKTAIKESGKSREQVIDEMRRVTGITVSMAMLDAYIAETNQNNFPAHLVPAFCLATGSTRLLDLLCAAAGCFVADQRQHDLARLAEAEIEAEALRREKRNLRERLARR